jgi:hypothetical protein
MKEFCQVFPLRKFVYINIKASQTMQLTHHDAIVPEPTARSAVRGY